MVCVWQESTITACRPDFSSYAFVFVLFRFKTDDIDDGLSLLFMFRVDFLHKSPRGHPTYMFPANHGLVTLLSNLWNGRVQQGNQ